jgi:myo-inositol-1(or 4)-monophosphatase
LAPYSKERNEAIALARLAGTVMMHYYDIEYEKTEKDDAKSKAEAILTEVDLKIDKIIRTFLSSLWPEDALLTEETPPEAEWFKAHRIWIVDPLDGTLGYVKKTGSFGISIALIEDGRPVVGVLYAPATDTLAVGVAGQGVTLDGKPVDLSDDRELKHLVLSSNSFKKVDYQTAMAVLGNPPIFKMESVVVKVLKLLAGKGEVYFFTPLSDTQPSVPKFWDIAAADLIVNEAGGHGTDFDGNLYRYDRDNFKCEGGALFGYRAAHQLALEKLKNR